MPRGLRPNRGAILGVRFPVVSDAFIPALQAEDAGVGGTQGDALG